MPVMERFGTAEGPTGAVGATPIFGRWPDALEDAHTSGGRDGGITHRAGGPGAPRAGRWDGLVALGAVGGSAAGLAVGATAGFTGTAASLAVLVGLDLGVLVGAAASVLVSRRRREPVTPQAAVWER